AATISDESVRDLRDLLWASIDNDDSMDLDQLTVAELVEDGMVKVRVAIADVDALVHIWSAIDEDAAFNTTSIYTAAIIYPMLPEKLSTNLTSLNPGEDRLAVVVEMTVDKDGYVADEDIYRAYVHNHAKLAYNAVAAWLDGEGEIPEQITKVDGLAENLRMQDETAQLMKNFRETNGALSLETIEARPVFDGEQIQNLEIESRNRAKEIIENLMIGANGVTARYLSSKGFPSIRRVVRSPERWDRIVQLADSHGYRLPDDPNSTALEAFLVKEKSKDPMRFPDLSLAIIKLMGNGEYVAQFSGQTAPGHFGLAVKDYSHSTAPNRRYTDLITQRLLKAALEDAPVPYSNDDLDDLARHCTEQEDIVNKVERQIAKSAGALLLQSRIGERFDALVTGASQKGTWARLLDIPVEGKLIRGYEGIDVGDKIRVELISVDVDRGYIDFRIAGMPRH
ncbi:MAG: RNB domain-containing ribonuclease, partial [Armatimonadota bacterium]